MPENRGVCWVSPLECEKTNPIIITSSSSMNKNKTENPMNWAGFINIEQRFFPWNGGGMMKKPSFLDALLLLLLLCPKYCFLKKKSIFQKLDGKGHSGDNFSLFGNWQNVLLVPHCVEDQSIAIALNCTQVWHIVLNEQKSTKNQQEIGVCRWPLHKLNNTCKHMLTWSELEQMYKFVDYRHFFCCRMTTQ